MPRTRSGARRNPWGLFPCTLLAISLGASFAIAEPNPLLDTGEAGESAAPQASKSGAPWDVLATSGGESRFAGDSNQLRVVLQPGERASCSKRIGFDPTVRGIVCRFDLSLAGAGSAGTTQVFQMGSGFSGPARADAGSAYARLGLIGSDVGTGFRLRDLATGRSSPVFNGTQAITWTLNHSAQSISYAAPNGTIEPIASERMDVWVGRNKVFDDITVAKRDAPVTDLEWLWGAGSGTTSFAHLEVQELMEAEVVAAPDRNPETTAAPSADSSPADDGVALYRPWPNPFEGAVRFAYAIPGGFERVDIGVFDVAGRAIRSLVHGVQGTGRYEVIWNGLGDDGLRARDGVYFLRASVGPSSRIVRVILLK